MKQLKRTKTSVERLAPESIIWDAQVPGFYARRQRGAAVAYGVKTRLDGRIKWVSIGRHGAPWTTEEARPILEGEKI